MEDYKNKKQDLRDKVQKKLNALSRDDLRKRTKLIENQLFEFANFQEAEVALLYIGHSNEVDTRHILKRCREEAKEIVLPLFSSSSNGVRLFKISNIDTDLKTGPDRTIEPDPQRCKPVGIEHIDIAIIPGLVFDEKGGRLGDGSGRYDRLIPKLPTTARKIAVALEDQIAKLVPMESHDKYMDIIITDKRIIYKI